MLALATLLVFQAGLEPDFVQQMEPAPILLVHSEIQGKNVVLGVDTGSFEFILKPGVASKEQGQTADVTIPFLSNSPVKARIVDFPTAVTGVIGLNYLRQKAIGIDVENQAMSVWDGGRLTKDQIDFYFSNKADVVAKDWRPSAIHYDAFDLHDSGDGHLALTVNINGKPLEFGLDTDAGITGVDRSGVAANGFVQIADTHFTGLDRNWKVNIGIVDSLSIGANHWQSFPMAINVDDPLKHVDGLLGFAIFQNRRAIIDIPARKLYLGSQNDNPSGDEALLPFGIRLTPLVKGKQYVGVIPNSPAALAGVKSGDEILSVEGKPVSPKNYARTGTTLPIDLAKLNSFSTLTVQVRDASGEAATRTLSLAVSKTIKERRFSLH